MAVIAAEGGIVILLDRIPALSAVRAALRAATVVRKRAPRTLPDGVTLEERRALVDTLRANSSTLAQTPSDRRR